MLTRRELLSPSSRVIVAEFSDMHEENQNLDRNVYKIKAFALAISTLKQLDHPLRSIEEAKKVNRQFLPCTLGLRKFKYS
jgi:DNA polymerase/3'-5' exonuclease PolX